MRCRTQPSVRFKLCRCGPGAATPVRGIGGKIAIVRAAITCKSRASRERVELVGVLYPPGSLFLLIVVVIVLIIVGVGVDVGILSHGGRSSSRLSVVPTVDCNGGVARLPGTAASAITAVVIVVVFAGSVFDPRAGLSEALLPQVLLLLLLLLLLLCRLAQPAEESR